MEEKQEQERQKIYEQNKRYIKEGRTTEKNLKEKKKRRKIIEKQKNTEIKRARTKYR